jgi:hypothetical protein
MGYHHWQLNNYFDQSFFRKRMIILYKPRMFLLPPIWTVSEKQKNPPKNSKTLNIGKIRWNRMIFWRLRSQSTNKWILIVGKPTIQLFLHLLWLFFTTGVTRCLVGEHTVKFQLLWGEHDWCCLIFTVVTLSNGICLFLSVMCRYGIYIKHII